METKCEKCGGELITGRLTTGVQMVTWTPLSDEKKLRPRRMDVVCDCCGRCGAISNLRVRDTESAAFT